MANVLLLFLTLNLPQAGPDTLRVYEARYSSDPITPDGNLDDGPWSQAPWTEDFVHILGSEGPTPTHRTRAKILWDDQNLYVGACLEEPHLWATLEKRDAIIYRDDDFEVFLDPDADGLDYFEFEINALGTVLDLFLPEPYRRGGRAEIGWNATGLRSSVSLSGTLNDPSDLDEGWCVEMSIPWVDLVPPGIEDDQVQAETEPAAPRPGLPPQTGDSWRINLSRVDWPLAIEDGGYRKASNPSRQDPHPESNWVWSPQGAIDMHLPERWGVVRFIADPQNSPFD